VTSRAGSQTVVLKVGGAVADVDGALLAIPRLTNAGYAVVIVHGGGQEISAWMNRLGIPVAFKDGLRVTGPESVQIATMVLCGKVRTSLVAALVHRGVKAMGVSGVDGGLLAVRPHKDPDLGLVGEVEAVDAYALRLLTGAGYVPVISPIAQDGAGNIRNVNADSVCGAVAGALGATLAVFLTDVPGVKDRTGALMARLSPAQVESLIASGIIHGGMIPKVRACLAALESGAEAVCIADGRDTRALDFLLHGQAPTGTIIVKPECGEGADREVS
jgi:acetylglutamate kinase